MSGMLVGAVAGLLATGPMTAVMSRLFRDLPPSDRHPLPPRLITERILGPPGLLDGVPEKRRTDISLMAHYGYGAATGALYPLAARLAGGPPLATGVTYGVIVWAASYLGWIPITGTLTRATRHSPRRNALMIAAHAVWGGCTAVIAESLQRSPAGFGAAGGAVVPVPPEIPQSRVGPPATARPRRERSDRLWGLAAAAAAGGALAWGLGMRPATRRAPRP